MRKKMSTAAKIRRMLAKGYEPKEIARRLDCPVQQIYTVRYHENRKMGIGALVTETPAPIPVVGVATPKKRGRPRKETVDTSDREKYVVGTPLLDAAIAFPPSQAPMPVVIPTKPSMAQRVKEWFASWR